MCICVAMSAVWEEPGRNVPLGSEASAAFDEASRAEPSPPKIEPRTELKIEPRGAAAESATAFCRPPPKPTVFVRSLIPLVVVEVRSVMPFAALSRRSKLLRRTCSRKLTPSFDDARDDDDPPPP
jgi:hypothetical protein